MTTRVVLITGAAQRVGAAMAWRFHRGGYRVCVHYRHSGGAATRLVAALNAERPESAVALAADLSVLEAAGALPGRVMAAFGRLDVLINNASSFYPTPLGSVDGDAWDEVMNSNLKGPFFLSQACLPQLQERRGCIVNIADIHAERPLREHPVYCIAKAGVLMLTRSLALEASPAVRVNAIAPGAILWPAPAAQPMDEAARQALLAKVPQGRLGDPDDIAAAAWFLAEEAPYTTGQIIAVDGGRSLNQ